MNRRCCYSNRTEPMRGRLAAFFVLFLDSVSAANSSTSSRLYTTSAAYLSGFSHRDSRSFAVEKVIPAIGRATELFDSTANIPYSAIGEALPVLYTNNPSIVYKWLSDHLPSDGCTIGFDVESVPYLPWLKWKTHFFGPATVQLSTVDAALVIQLTRSNGIPSKACAPILDAVLKDEAFVKAGVGCDQDMLDLYRWCDGALEARSRFELGGIRASTTTESPGLKTLARCILGVDMVKTKRLAKSNWGQVPLTDAQLAYCARDAWAGAAIMATLGKCDPETFATSNLVRMLESQRSLRDLDARSKQRKSVKQLLAKISAPYKENSQEWLDNTPIAIRERINGLRSLMKELTPDRVTSFDIEPLGF